MRPDPRRTGRHRRQDTWRFPTTRQGHAGAPYTSTPRRYEDGDDVWTNLSHGAGPLIGLRILPLAIMALVVTVNLLFAPEVEVRYYMLAAPLLMALVNGPIVTLAVSAAVLAVYVAGEDCPVSDCEYGGTFWARVASLGGLFLLATGITWLRGRVRRRYESITAVAEKTQEAIVPEAPDRVGPFAIASVLRTPEGYANLVGGDFFAVEPYGRGIRLILGDVKGHDLATIQLTNILMGAFRERAMEESDVTEVARRLHERLSVFNGSVEPFEEYFATAVVAEFDPDAESVTLVNCGHPPPVFVGREADLVEVRPLPPLGVEHGESFCGRALRLPFRRGDMVHFYSDGMSEARNHGGEVYPMVGLMNEYLARGLVREPEPLIWFLRDQFYSHGFVIADDMSSLTIGYGNDEEEDSQ
ncbi:PP2C family protein-serine/threonine phosphatase [Salininema proteolyticum]|uniref:PP2C family protein-serine/threonine phosphatase n=1 Tax=Salininema proteolyticum TaxID=1607685 RepID=A0ABV8U1C9_9ACTN